MFGFVMVVLSVSQAPSQPPEMPIPKELPKPAVDAAGVDLRPLIFPGGRVRYVNEVQVPSVIPGQLVEVLVREGDVVSPGQKLARIDDETATLEAKHKGIAAKNQAAIEAANARIGWFKQQYETGLTLKKRGATSAEEVEGRRQQLVAAEHELRNEQSKREQAEADYDRTRAQLTRHTLTSPIAGVVRERRRHAFEAVQALETVFHIVRTDRMRIECEFDQRELGRIARGMPVEVWPERLVGEIDRINHAAAVWCVRVLPAGNRLAFSTADGMIVVWNYARHRREQVIRASQKPVRAIAICPLQPGVIAAGDDDGVVSFWNIDTGAEARGSVTTSTSTPIAVTALELDPKNASVGYLGFANGKVQCWNWQDNASTREFTTNQRPAHVSQVTSLSIDRDGKRLLTVGDDRAVAVWNTDGGGLARFAGRDAPPDREVRQLNFSPSGDEVACNFAGLLQLRNTLSGLPTGEIERVGSRDSFAWLAVFAPRTGMLLTARDAGDLELWRLAEGRPSRLARTFVGHEKDRPIRRADFSADGRLLATCGDDRTVRLWRIPSAEEIDAERMPGVVTFVSPQIEPGTNSVKLHVEAANADGLLTANARATVVVHAAR